MAFRRFSPVVQTTLRRMLGPNEDLEDLAQDVFLRFFCKVRGLRKVESIRPFVMAIASRRAQEEFRRRRTRRWFAPLLPSRLTLPPSSETDPDAREVIGHLYQLAERLRATDRTIYALRFIQCLYLPEISALVGVSLSTVRRRLGRLNKQVTSLMRSDPVLAPYVAFGRMRAEVGASSLERVRQRSPK